MNATKVTINGIILDFNLNSGALGWSSDWAEVYSLVAAGYLKAVHGGHGTYGHTDFFLTPKGKRVVS